MARIVVEIRENEIRDRIREAQVAKGDVPMDPWQLSRMAYGYFEFLKIERHLKDQVPRAQVSLQVARLAGIAQAVEHLLIATELVPLPLHSLVSAELRNYQLWAHQYAISTASDDDMRLSIQARLDEADLWDSWARRIIDTDHSGAPKHTAVSLMMALNEKLQAYGALLQSGNQDRLETALEVQDGWFRWAQAALGLSDAYIEEQKLGIDDLRRMIRERL